MSQSITQNPTTAPIEDIYLFSTCEILKGKMKDESIPEYIRGLFGLGIGIARHQYSSKGDAEDKAELRKYALSLWKEWFGENKIHHEGYWRTKFEEEYARRGFGEYCSNDCECMLCRKYDRKYEYTPDEEEEDVCETCGELEDDCDCFECFDCEGKFEGDCVCPRCDDPEGDDVMLCETCAEDREDKTKIVLERFERLTLALLEKKKEKDILHVSNWGHLVGSFTDSCEGEGEYPCFRCEKKCDFESVCYCGGGGDCETWYCGDCYAQGTNDCDVCLAMNA